MKKIIVVLKQLFLIKVFVVGSEVGIGEKVHKYLYVGADIL